MFLQKFMPKAAKAAASSFDDVKVAIPPVDDLLVPKTVQETRDFIANNDAQKIEAMYREIQRHYPGMPQEIMDLYIAFSKQCGCFDA